MSLMDRLRAWFKGETSRTAAKKSKGSKSTREPSGTAAKELDEFVRSRRGVEGYLEPKTSLYPTTLLLVASDGEYLRRPVKDRGQAATVCEKHGIPLYDARQVGYPRRMRDKQRGSAPRHVDLDDLPPWPGDDDTASDAPAEESVDPEDRHEDD